MWKATSLLFWRSKLADERSRNIRRNMASFAACLSSGRQAHHEYLRRTTRKPLPLSRRLLRTARVGCAVAFVRLFGRHRWSQKRDHCSGVRRFPDFPGDRIAGAAFGEEKIERSQYAAISGYAGGVCFAVFNVVGGAGYAVPHQSVLPCHDDPSRRALYPIRVLIRYAAFRISGGNTDWWRSLHCDVRREDV